MLFILRFIEMVNATPQAPALADGVSSLSYQELYERARSMAKIITSTSSGLMIGVFIEKSIDYIVSILAIHLSGKTVIPLDSGYPIERLRQMIDAIDLSLCLINNGHRNELSSMLKQQTHCLHIDSLSEASTNNDFNLSQLDETPAYVVFTSGTTGCPKPVLVPYRSLSALVAWMIDTPKPIGTTLLYAAPGFDVSFQEIYSTLCHGDRLLIITDGQKKDLHALSACLSVEAVTRLFLPTSMLTPFVTFDLHQACRLTDLSQVIVAGEQLNITPAVRKWFGAHPQCRLLNHYGPSETHVVMEHRLDGAPEDWPDLPPIGQVVPGSTAFLLDEQMQHVGLGDAGQLYIAGRSVALGYYGMPKQTAEKFVLHPLTQERMYNTGDICVVNPQGFYEYKGRLDRQCKIRGYRVELKEIEAVMANSALVADCLVVARKSGQTTSLVLYFTAQEHEQDISLSLHMYLAARLPDYMLPSFYKRIAAIPLTRNGKVDSTRLPEIGSLRSQQSSIYAAPRGEFESQVCELAASCFGLDRIGANDNFMKAGATSIALISLLAELNYVLGHDFRQTDLFEYPTPRQLCETYQRDRDERPIAISMASVANRKLRAAAIHNIHSRGRG